MERIPQWPTVLRYRLKEMAGLGCKKEQCGQARSFNPVGVNPTPARQASHRIENFGLAGVIPKTKHRGIKTAGRKRELNG